VIQAKTAATCSCRFGLANSKTGSPATASASTQTVNTAALSITANADSKTYGQTKSYGSGQTAFTIIGLQNSETIGTVTLTASGGTAATDAATMYSLTPSAATDGTFTSSNYTITYHAGTLTVNPLAVSLTGSRPYDATTTAAASILSVANKVGSDVVTVASGSGTLAGATPGSQAITDYGTLALGGVDQHRDHAGKYRGKEDRVRGDHHPGSGVDGGAKDGELAGEGAEGRRAEYGEQAGNPERARHGQGPKRAFHVSRVLRAIGGEQVAGKEKQRRLGQ